MPEDMGFSTVLNTTVMNLCDGGDHEGKICQAYTQFPNGYIFEQFAADEPFCSSWILMSGMRLWPKGQLTIMYGLALAYCFLGVAIIADVFMGAIEVITSKSVTYNRVNEDTGEEEEVTVQFWNPTVANLSLMALGSSAPEILLAVIGTFATLDGTPDVLGPATIVGSAAFNLLVICAICIAAIPDGEFRRINQMSVYTITATCSVFAYVWLFIVLSDEVVKAWEAWLTFMMFWILLVVAWAADNNFWRGDALGDKGGNGSENLEGSRRPSFSSNMPSASAINAVDISIQGKDQHLHMGKSDAAQMQRELLFMAKDVKKDFKGKSKEEQQKILEAQLLAKMHKSEPPPSRMQYRMNAIKGMAGKKRALPGASQGLPDYATVPEEEEMQNVAVAAGADPNAAIGTVRSAGGPREPPPKICTFKFKSAHYAILESGGEVEITVERVGPCDFAASVLYDTRDGTATHEEDYSGVTDAKLTFGPRETEQTFTIAIIDDNQWEPDETFYCELHDAKSEHVIAGKEVAIHAKYKDTEVTILNDDTPGQIQFAFATVAVKETCGDLEIAIQRKNGCDGSVSVKYNTLDDTAIAGTDYETTAGVITFEHGENASSITIPIHDNSTIDNRKLTFKVLLTNPTGGATLTALKRCTVTVCQDDEFTGMLDKLTGLIELRKSKFVVGSSTWSSQFSDALTIEGEVDEAGEDQDPATMDYVMHFLTIPWKVLFATCPPTDYFGGWVCFGVAISQIGMLTAIIGELAALFGCCLGLKTSVTAITFVALGTSLPDTFASVAAAQQDEYADASVGNVVGSNSVNVFLGLGLPWVIGSIYHGGDYPFPKGDLELSVLVFTACALTCFAVLTWRRVYCEGELGGPPKAKKISAGILVSLWFIYVTCASMKAYGMLG